MTELFYDEIESPVGIILTAWHGTDLCALDYEDYRKRMLQLLHARFGEVKLTPRKQTAFRASLKQYFAGDLAALDAVKIDGGGTTFQRSTWAALRTIPAGRTATYGEIAAQIGSPSAARAVGLANSLNPIAIVVPCHRVVGANGNLTGYAGGLDRKRWLLAHESSRLMCAAQTE
jgi:methylated-DNA-[protein]-cysteine S-methyltransferase